MLTQIIAILVLTLFSTLANASDAYIKLTSDTTDIYVGDAIVIDIEYSGLLDPPLFDHLKKTARFDRETYGTRIAVHKSKVVEIHIRRMEFHADSPGTLLFGPLESDGIISNSITIDIEPARNSNWAPQQTDATIEMTISPENPTIYQMVTLDIVLRHSYPIAEERIQLPTLNKFKTRRLLTERRTIDTDSRRQISWRFLLFPEAAGNHIIAGVKWSGKMNKSRSERAVFTRNAQSLTLSVQPIPAKSGYQSDKADWWLPTSNLKLEEKWSKDVRELRAGDEVMRVITLKANDVTAGQLPKINVLESRAISQTLVNTERQEVLLPNGIESTATFTYRARAQSPIPVFLDTVRVAWWNTVNAEHKEAIIPARRINIGLPERADLLAQLASENQKRHWLKRISNFPFASALKKANWLWPVTVLLALLATAIFAKLLFAHDSTISIKNPDKATRIPASRKFLLRQLAIEEQWGKLYTLLLEQSPVTATRHTGHATAHSSNHAIIKLRKLVGQAAFSNCRPDKKQSLWLKRQVMNCLKNPEKFAARAT